MNLTQNELLRGITLLNRSAVHIQGTDIRLYVHYWGGESALNDNEWHKHSFFEICYIVSGSGLYLENGKQYPLTEGDMFVSRPHIQHRICNTSGLYIVFVAFEPVAGGSTEEAMARFHSLSNADPFLLRKVGDTAVVRMWEALLLQAKQEYPLLQDTLGGLCCSLIVSFTHQFAPDEETKSVSIHRFSNTLVHRAKLYIRDNLSQPLRLKDVAAYLHISNRHLSRLFADELGRSFSDYVRSERVRQAAFLLSTTDRSIKSVSEETGFATVHYFTSVFKEVLGMTPGEFHKSLDDNQ